MSANSLGDLRHHPVHGPGGRVALLRQRLGMRQTDFARELTKYGARASRETISHWENFDAAGQPRARVSRRNARALASLASAHGLSFAAESFIEGEEKPWETLERLQMDTATQLGHLAAALADVVELIERRGSMGALSTCGRHVVLRMTQAPPVTLVYRSSGGVVSRVWSEP